MLAVGVRRRYGFRVHHKGAFFVGDRMLGLGGEKEVVIFFLQLFVTWRFIGLYVVGPGRVGVGVVVRWLFSFFNRGLRVPTDVWNRLIVYGPMHLLLFFEGIARPGHQGFVRFRGFNYYGPPVPHGRFVLFVSRREVDRARLASAIRRLFGLLV